MNTTARKLLANLAALLALAGCASESSPVDDDNGGRDPNDPSSIDIQRGRVLASLMRADSCDDLLGQIQDDVAAKIELQAEQLKRGEEYAYQSGGTGGLSGGFDDDGAAPPSAGAGNGGAGGSAGTGAAGFGSPAPGSDGESSAGGGGTGGGAAGNGDPVDLGPSDYSDTNTQVEGVDEADIVKTDGERIYLVHGNELFVLKSWPASESTVESSIKLEGSVQELFVHEGKAAVFSYLYDQGDLIAPRPSDQAGDAYYPGYSYGTAFTKITLIDLARALPVVERELIIEGSYLSSRRHGKTVRAVLQGGFRTPPVYYAEIQYRDPWGREYSQDDIDAQVDAWRDRMIAGVRMTTIDDWLPAEREVIDGVLTPPDRRCTDFYAPPPALTSYGLTNVVSFDMLDPTGSLGGAIVLGSADEVYSNSDVLLLAQRDYRWDARLAERSRTILHLFNLSEDETAYAASGFAPGHIVDQFSLDEQAGIVRLTTTTQAWNEWSSEIATPAQDDPWVDIAEERMTDNRVITLRIDDGKLVRAGVSDSLGEDGETIFSTRFVGDRAYVVTFRQTDPLVVVDTSDPEDPTVIGELHIPGFSDYMHPIDSDHLLTIGRDADENGSQRGLLLQVFDVTDPTNPVLAHRHAYTQDGWSEANGNHKAFTYFDPGDDSPYEGLLAFPFVNYSGNFQSSLEVFDVSIEGGFTKLGSVDHTALVMNCFAEQYGGEVPPDVYYDPYYCGAPEVRRGMFVTGNDDDEYVYSISHGGMLVHQLPELATPVATVQLPQADTSEHRAYYGGGSTQTPGTGGVAGGIGGSAGGIAGGGAGGIPDSGGGVAGGGAGTGAGGAPSPGGTGGGTAGIGGTAGTAGVGGASGDGSGGS